MTGREPPVLHTNKWITVAACATLQLSAGLCYSFGIYSSELKSAFRWSQSELTGFGTALNLGAFAAFIPGALYNALGRICLAIAAFECFAGMGVIWGATTGHLQLSYPALLVAAFVFSNSNATIDIVSVSTNVTNWPNDRGSAVGVMKAAVGLSASVYGVLYGALRLGTSSFMLLMMLAPSLSCLLLMPLVNTVPWIQKSELMPRGSLSTASRFYMSYQVLFLIAIFTALASAVLHDSPPPALRAAIVPVLAVLCLCNFVVTVFSGGLRSRPAHAHLHPALHHEAPAVRRPPDSIVSHALTYEELMAPLRSVHAGRRSGDALVAERSVHRTYEIDAFLSEDLDGALAAEAAARPLLPHGAADAHELSARSSTSVASELYHEQPASDVTPLRALRTLEFHLLVFCCFVTMGAALGLLDNLDQILASFAPHVDGTAASHKAARERAELGQALLVGFSVSNLLGRVAAGYLSERLLHTKVLTPNVPCEHLPENRVCGLWSCVQSKHVSEYDAAMQGLARTFFFVVIAALTLLWLSLLAAAALLAQTPAALPLLVPTALLAGATFGASWTLMSVTTSELFGLTYFATNYATIQVAPMLATCLCPTLLVGRLYDRQARQQHPHAVYGDVSCSGTMCFLPAVAILWALAVLQVFAALVLWLRTRWIYEREAEHLREVEHNIVEEGSSLGVSESSHLQRAVSAAAGLRTLR